MNEIPLIVEIDENEKDEAQIFVDGTIDGQAYRFLLDSGAARTTVIADDQLLTYTAIGKDDTTGAFSKNKDELIQVKEVSLGPISKKDLVLARTTENVQHKTNLLGMDFLKDHRLHFYFDQNRIEVDADNQPKETLPLTLGSRFHPYVDVDFGKTRAKAVWDTGASITVVDMNLIKSHPHCFQEIGSSTGTDSTGTSMETPMFIMDTTMIGNKEFPPHKVAGFDLSHINASTEIPMHMILGYSTIRKANWYFDVPARKWAVLKRL
ncbi:MAG TPA: retropepsin-like aspartic protease [Bacillales bacterium]|nr:retropepsin-like aspartic protease [Bacillales bacterium]